MPVLLIMYALPSRRSHLSHLPPISRSSSINTTPSIIANTDGILIIAPADSSSIGPRDEAKETGGAGA